jgi:hypothetical protein
MRQVIEGRLDEVVERLRQMNAPGAHVRAVLSDSVGRESANLPAPASEEQMRRILAEAEDDLVDAPNADFSRASIYERDDE